MKTYLISCRPTIKPAYRKNYWYSNCQPLKSVSCETPREALNMYIDDVLRSEFDISKTAIKRAEAMYLDLPDGTTVRVGYIVTAFTKIEGKRVPFDLWIKLHEVIYPEKGW